MICDICRYAFGGLPEIQEIAFFEGKKENPLLSFAKAEAVVKSFKRVKLKGGAQIEKPAKNNQQRPPSFGWLKANVGAAIDVKNQRAGLGAVIRDSSDKIVVATTKKKTPKYRDNVVFAEAEVIKWECR